MKKKLKIFSSCCVVAGTKIYMEQFVWCAVKLHFLLPHTEQICRLCVSGERVAIGGGGEWETEKKKLYFFFISLFAHKVNVLGGAGEDFSGPEEEKNFFS